MVSVGYSSSHQRRWKYFYATASCDAIPNPLFVSHQALRLSITQSIDVRRQISISRAKNFDSGKKDDLEISKNTKLRSWSNNTWMARNDWLYTIFTSVSTSYKIIISAFKAPIVSSSERYEASSWDADAVSLRLGCNQNRAESHHSHSCDLERQQTISPMLQATY